MSPTRTAKSPASGKRNLLVIMAKKPVPGSVKTRMIPLLGERGAAELYEALLGDTLELAAGVGNAGLAVACAPKEAMAFFQNLVSPGTLLLPQPEGDMGERIGAVFRLAFDTSAGAVCLLNSDGPDLPPGRIREAFGRLESGEAQAVFGPNPDGGYYLVGLRSPADIFRDIPWSTERVLEVNLERAGAEGLTTSLLAPWPDLDTPADLAEALRRWRAGPATPPRRTFELLTRLSASGLIPPGS